MFVAVVAEPKEVASVGRRNMTDAEEADLELSKLEL